MKSIILNCSRFQMETQSKTNSRSSRKVFSDHVVMVYPHFFYCNEQTVGDNIYQANGAPNQHHDIESHRKEIHQKALKEIDAYVKTLRKNKIQVTLVQDQGEDSIPDCIFPNNWISFHQNKEAVIYPMLAPNRRNQRKLPVLKQLSQELGIEFRIVRDYSEYENENLFLEGTGSLVLDSENRVAYACLSQRTNKELLDRFCSDINFKQCSFHASQFCSERNQNVPIYHTNFMMSVSEKFVLVCLDSLDTEEEKDRLTETIKSTGKQMMTFSLEQLSKYLGNSLTLRNSQGQLLIVMSKFAEDCLTKEQRDKIQESCRIVSVSIPTIEEHGGGSARCMLAEVFKA